MIKPDLQIAFITGRSRADNCSLSPAQATFIQQVVGHHQHVDVNFPWTVQSVPWLATGLLRASVNNAREYLGARQCFCFWTGGGPPTGLPSLAGTRRSGLDFSLLVSPGRPTHCLQPYELS